MTTPAPDATSKSTAYFELAVSIYLYQWQALSLAVSNEWGGHDSSDKRDWLIGTISDLYTTNATPPELEDVEDILIQVMSDEFQVMLEDDSAYEVAKQVNAVWIKCQNEEFDEIVALRNTYEAAKPGNSIQKGDVSSSSDDEEGDEGDNEDSEMTDAPTSTKLEPIIDEDGFELVQPKRRNK